jgi:dihydrofolate synthase/folylpolyglutamate synthase
VSGLSYAAALEAIADRGRFGVRLGLGRTRALLAGLGNPEGSIRGALVAGTNGKGSVLALAGAALQAAGYRVGMTPKPHLVSYRERLEIDGRPIDPGAFAALIEEVLPIADRNARRLGPATEFELLTAAMFLWFARQRVDVALVEVGLGGRLDATHAWRGGVAAITNVDLDHTEVLGPTIGAIAREKAAIIESGDVAVTGATGEAREVIARRARRVGAPLSIVDPAPLLRWDRDSISVSLPGLGDTRVGLRGRHQAANVAVANALLDALEAAGIARAPQAARRAGYASARWPGRLELLEVPRRGSAANRSRAKSGTVEVLLDGAHNPAGAAALAAALLDLRPFLAGGRDAAPAPLTLVVGIMADKDVAGVLAALSGPALDGARVICTQVDGPRALPADRLAAAWQTAKPAGTSTALLDPPAVEPDPTAAMDLAIRTAPGPIVVAGSLYLVGRARAQLVPDAWLIDPAPAPAASAPAASAPAASAPAAPGAAADPIRVRTAAR